MKKIIFTIIIMVSIIQLSTAAHWIVGYVNDAPDGEPANGKTVTLWNSTNTSSNNLTDIVGPTGNSNTNNVYFIDCEQEPISCQIGDVLSIKIFDNGSGYFTNEVNVTVSAAGFTEAENLSFVEGIEITSIEVEDSLTFPLNEIDLSPATTKTITCTAIIKDSDTETNIKNASAKFFSGNYADPDDNNNHYTNDSCDLNQSYGDSTEVEAKCSFEIEYYADTGTWNCTMEVFDIAENSKQNSDTTSINSLLALGVDSPLNFGTVNATKVSAEVELNITNYGNVPINLSLSGYAKSENDGNSMNCSQGDIENITINYQKYNLSTANPGDLTLSQFEKTYTNLTTTPEIKSFNLNQRQDDLLNEAINKTYWRVYVPEGVAGSCSGNIVFGAIQGPET